VIEALIVVVGDAVLLQRVRTARNAERCTRRISEKCACEVHLVIKVGNGTF